MKIQGIANSQPDRDTDVIASRSYVPPDKDFFALLTAKRQASSSAPNVDDELSKYLSDRSHELESLHSYPHIRQLYIALNTGLPSSAAVERLFSLGGSVFSPLRSRLSADHFEMLTFLRSSKWWFHCCAKSMANNQTIKHWSIMSKLSIEQILYWTKKPTD